MIKATITFGLLLFSWARAEVGRIAEMQLLAGAPLHLVRGEKVEPCQFRPHPKGAILSCPQPLNLEFAVEMPGFEPRMVKVDTWQSELELTTEGWIPKPILLRVASDLGPITALWWDGQDLVTASASNGTILGPRVNKASQLVLVGPGIKPAVLTLSPEQRGTEIPVPLEAGQSVAVVCLDPWTGRALATCLVEVGAPMRAVTHPRDATSLTFGLRNIIKGHSLPGAAVLEAPELPKDDQLLLVAWSNDLPPIVRPFAPTSELVWVQLAQPTNVRFRLESSEGKAVEGTIRVAVETGQGPVTVLERQTDTTGSLDLALAPGRYQVLADAMGYAPATENLRAGGSAKEVHLILEPRATARGVVLDSRGNPLAQAVVIATEVSGTIEAFKNVAQTDEQGNFLVTLPGSGPWRLLAQKEGFANAALSLSTPADKLVFVLEERCRVALRLLGPSGLPLEVSIVGAFREKDWDVQISKERSSEGVYFFFLSPGSWTVVAEEEDLWGSVQIADGCEGFAVPVILMPRQQVQKKSP